MRKLKNSELARLDEDAFREAEKIPVVIVLDNVRSGNNIGSVFRSSDAFLVEKIYLCGISARPPHKDIHKTALGATDTVAWEYRERTEDAILELRETHHCLAVEQAENSTYLQDLRVEKNKRYVLVFGHEVKGVSQEVVNLCHEVVEIPQYGTKHSLNIAVSAGILIWDLWSKLQQLKK